MNTILTLIILAFFANTNLIAKTKTITAWSYYDYAPYSVDPNKKIGMSYDFVEMLNQDSKGVFKLDLKILPRKRMDYEIAQGKEGLVLWAIPKSLKDPDMVHFLWTPPIFKDKDEIVSLSTKPIKYSGPDSLVGLIFGGILGHRYAAIDEYIDNKKIKRVDAKKHSAIVSMLLKNRIEVTTLPGTVSRYIIDQLGIQGKLYFSPTPLLAYQRRILLQPTLKEEQRFLSKLMIDLDLNPKWKQILNNYGLIDLL